MSVRSKVIDIDRGYDNLLDLGRMRPSGVDIGVFGDAKNKGKSVAEYATKNEFGIKVPERSFMRATFDQNADKINDMITAFVRAFIKGVIKESAFFKTVGSMLQTKIKERISTSKRWAIPNAPSTIRRKKGGDTPLIDTNRLRQSIVYKTTN